MSTLVTNEPRLMCCGEPRGKCTCDSKQQPTGRRQSFMGQAVGNLSGDSAPTEEEMLNVPTWNFEDTEVEQSSTAANAKQGSADGGPSESEMLGVPSWEF